MEIELDYLDHTLTYTHVICVVSEDETSRRYFIFEDINQIFKDHPNCKVHIYHITVTCNNTHMTLRHAKTKLCIYYVKVDGHWVIDTAIQNNGLH